MVTGGWGDIWGFVMVTGGWGEVWGSVMVIGGERCGGL